MEGSLFTCGVGCGSPFASSNPPSFAAATSVVSLHSDHHPCSAKFLATASFQRQHHLFSKPSFYFAHMILCFVIVHTMNFLFLDKFKKKGNLKNEFSECKDHLFEFSKLVTSSASSLQSISSIYVCRMQQMTHFVISILNLISCTSLGSLELSMKQQMNEQAQGNMIW